MPRWLKVITVLAYSLGIVLCIYFISGENPTPHESAMVGVILAILSILATWSVSHYYSESQHNKALKEVQEFHRTNIKTYARKAAEKVTNLSNELSRLSGYLEKELARTDYDNPEEELNAKEERIESAIHITNTLKSINDTALSDWEGVIGDELEQRRVEQREREEELEDLLSRHEAAISSLETDIHDQGANTLVFQREIDSLRKELRFVASRIGIISPTLLRPFRSSRNIVEAKCPVCDTLLSYKQKPKESSIKPLKCSSCGSKLVSLYDKTFGFHLEVRQAIREKLSCPSCGATVEIELDQVPGTSMNVDCSSCSAKLRVVRVSDGLRITKIGQPSVSAEQTIAPKLDEQLIESVRVQLPKQPWPKGTHKMIADKLKLKQGLVYSAINELIRRGVFNPQINGKLYVPAQPPTEKDQG